MLFSKSFRRFPNCFLALSVVVLLHLSLLSFDAFLIVPLTFSQFLFCVPGTKNVVVSFFLVEGSTPIVCPGHKNALLFLVFVSRAPKML